MCGHCSVSELQFVGVAVCESRGVGELRWGELWCVAVMVWGSCIVGESQCVGGEVVIKP